MNDVFISYSRKNKEFVQKLNESFKQHQRQVWVDWEDIPLGAQWWQEIEKGIEQANALVFTLSPDSVDSSVCRQEIEHAIKQNKRIIPIVYQAVDPNKVHPHLAALNWIFFTQPENFEQSFQALLTTLDTDLEYVRTHTRLLNRAIEWENRQRDSSFLLRGKELREAEQWLSIQTKEPQPTALQTQYIMKSSQRQAKQQGVTLFITGIGLVMMIVLALFAIHKMYESIQSQVIALDSLSKVRLVTHDEIGSLLAGMNAMKQMQRLWFTPKSVQQQIALTLRQALGSVQEYNRLEGHTEPVRDMVYSPNGQFILSTSSDRTAKMWKRDGRLLFSQDLAGSGASVDFSPDGKTFVVTTTKGHINVWDVSCLLQHDVNRVRSGDQVPFCQLHTFQQDDARAIIFTPDGRGLIVGSGRSKVINFWNIEEGKIIRTLQGHKDPISDLSISPDGEWLASASEDATVKIWHLRDGQLYQSLEDHEDRVYGVKFSPKDHLLASVSADNTMILWEMKDKLWSKKRTVEAHSNWVDTVNFSHDGQLIVTGSSDKTIKFWNLDGLLLKTLWNPCDVLSLDFSSDGKSLASAGCDQVIHLYSLEPMRTKILEGHRSSVKSVVFSPDGKMLASVGTDKTIKIWNGESGVLQKSYDMDSGAREVEFYPDGKMFALASYDKYIRLFDKDVHLLAQWPTVNRVKSLAFSPDGQTIATAITEQHTIQVRKLDGTLVNTFNGKQEAHQWTINDVASSPDGQLLTTASEDGTIKLWKPDGHLIKTLTGHGSWVNSVNFSHDGKYLVSASSDHDVKIWTREGALVRTLKGHTDWVWQAKFSPQDNDLVASASADNTVKLWNLEGKLLSTLEGHTNWVRALSFSPDGKKLATASADKTIILWDLAEELATHVEEDILQGELLKQACNRLGDYLKTNQNLKRNERYLCN